MTTPVPDLFLPAPATLEEAEALAEMIVAGTKYRDSLQAEESIPFDRYIRGSRRG
ncbi:MAG: hypothetical protein JNG85_08745 [Spirochaetaceae bacterium]|nr:hypothetical protein [Spirochaetaceae bacterium]